jgi:D-alanine-D-alanine ligase-like ATP-grasp enzyme
VTFDGLRICLLTDQELDAEPFPADDWPCDPRPWIPEADWTLVTLHKESCVAELVYRSRDGFDVFFNLCDGAWDEGRVGIEVVQTLEMLDQPFTGADSAFFEPSREAMKRVCAAWDVPTPRYVLARRLGDVERALDTLRFPMFVKHPSSYASNGLTRDSRVTDRAGLEREVSRCLAAWGGALVEEFVEGREATVLVAENPDDPDRPVAHTPLEYVFPEGETFKHYELKWVTYHGLGAAPVEDPALAEELRDLSRRFFVGMRGAGYGRCDLRLDAEGRPFMLEINPNCGVFYPATDPGSADLCLAAEPDGHSRFARRLVEAGLARWRRRQRGWEVRSTPVGGHGVFATRPFAAGDVVLDLLGLPHRVVRRNGERPPPGGLPLGDDLWLAWTDDPDAWVPLRRASSPSAELRHFEVVASRPLAPGEEVSLDIPPSTPEYP